MIVGTELLSPYYHFTEKEKEGRLRQGELIEAKARISQLKSEVASLEKSRKRACIEMEKDMEEFKSEHQVRQIACAHNEHLPDEFFNECMQVSCLLKS